MVVKNLISSSTLIGTTLDVDLVTYRSRGIVRILVGMLDSKVLEKRTADDGPYVGASCVVRLKEYGFYFSHEPADFVPDPNFVPLIFVINDSKKITMK